MNHKASTESQPSEPGKDHAAAADDFLHNPQLRVLAQQLIERDAAEKRATKNQDFVQVPRKTLKALGELAATSAGAMRLLMTMAQHMNRQNALVASYDTLGELAGQSRATVSRNLKLLRELRWIDRITVSGTSVLLVNSNAFWRASASGKRFAQFTATIVASEAEQDEPVDGRPKLQSFPFLQAGERALPSSEELPPPDQKDLDLA